MASTAASTALRAGLAFVLGASLARTVAAGDVEIPQKLLDHEARVRASLTPAVKARDAALEARVSSKMSVHDVANLTAGESSDVVMLVLMKYMKDVQKEVHENRKLQDAFVRQSLTAQASKLAQENTRLEASMQEGKERAQHLAGAANTGLAIGVAQGAVQIGGAVGNPSGGAGATGKAPVPTKTPTKSPGTKAP